MKFPSFSSIKFENCLFCGIRDGPKWRIGYHMATDGKIMNWCYFCNLLVNNKPIKCKSSKSVTGRDELFWWLHKRLLLREKYTILYLTNGYAFQLWRNKFVFMFYNLFFFFFFFLKMKNNQCDNYIKTTQLLKQRKKSNIQ